MINDLIRAGYVEVRWAGTKLFLKTFKRHGDSLFIMDGDPKRFRALYYDAEGTLLQETHHEIQPYHTATRDEGTPIEGDGIVR